MKPTTSEVLKAFEAEFKKLISTKNSWGKNEVLAAYQQALGDALIKVMDSDA